MGKTLIDTQLRNEILEFLGDQEGTDNEKAVDLYQRLKPKKRGRAKKVVDNTVVE